ncbi:MAG: AraC family transcriptional regulator [Lachnospiraceae bacterium]|nr:AraC family transcriptional regulator [Lachnospiraceae bacterium]MCI9477450.1 AraC family transcriptional regulator [Lachnospiraceae bacterium]MCI9622638.1 AraC family transcriptional regulator [Lachnospiraceae bacterium]
MLLTNLNLLDISLESGFSDIKYLNKAFAKQYGCSPKASLVSLNRLGETGFG